MVSRGCSSFVRLLVFFVLLSMSGCGLQSGTGQLTGGREAAPAPSCSGISARVVEVIDGDTVSVAFLPGPAVRPKGEGYIISGPQGPVQVFQREKVRLIGVDAPETGGKGQTGGLFGVKARNYTRQMLLNRVITLEFDVVSRDRYGRLLAYVYLEENLFNRLLLRAGYAQVYTSPPNLLHFEELLTAQRQAMESGRGLWGVRDFNAGRVIGNRRSYVYHRPGCTGLPALINRVWFDSEKDAVLAGYHACKSCFSRSPQEVGNWR